MTLHNRPSLRRYVELDHPGPALAGTLWNLLSDVGKTRAPALDDAESWPNAPRPAWPRIGN